MLTLRQLEILNGPYPPREVTAYFERVPKAAAEARIKAQREAEAEITRERLRSLMPITTNTVTTTHMVDEYQYFVHNGEIWQGQRILRPEPMPALRIDPPPVPPPMPSLVDRNVQRAAARIRDAETTRRAIDNLLGGRTRS